jgi:hypothetical protein
LRSEEGPLQIRTEEIPKGNAPCFYPWRIEKIFPPESSPDPFSERGGKGGLFFRPGCPVKIWISCGHAFKVDEYGFGSSEKFSEEKKIYAGPFLRP